MILDFGQKVEKKNRQNFYIIINCEKTTEAEKFCHDILNSPIKCAKPMVNLLMALGNETAANNPTSLSLSPFYQYHYSMIGKTTTDFGVQLNGEESKALKLELQQIFFERFGEQSVYKTSTDFTIIRKPESPTLEGRGFVNISNVRIYGNKPIDIGYYISCLNLHLQDKAHLVTWSLPLDNLRVDANADKIGVFVEQMSTIFKDKNLPFGQSQQIVNTADTGYTVLEFISPLINDFAMFQKFVGE